MIFTHAIKSIQQHSRNTVKVGIKHQSITFNQIAIQQIFWYNSGLIWWPLITLNPLLVWNECSASVRN